MGDVVEAYACVPLMFILSTRGRILVSSCKCCIGVVFVQPVAILNAVFCVVCSFWICVLAVSGCHAVCAYVSMGRMNCLYVVAMSSLE